MNEYIIDASAVLAVLQNEPGKERVEAILDRSSLGRVNATEILTSLINRGSDLADAVLALDNLELPVIELDESESIKIAELRPLTKQLGLSLGDRACLALAIQQNAIAITADRNWAQLDVCQIESIR